MTEHTRSWRRLLLHGGLVVVGVFLVLQLVPYGWSHSNPPVTSPAPWPTPEAEAIARQSCYDCHSNETEWPAYSYVAPASWLVRKDVDEGRSKLNFSEWDPADNEADDAVEEIDEGSMPLSNYTRLHGEAKLTDAEKATLSAALDQMASDSGGGRGGGDDDRDGD